MTIAALDETLRNRGGFLSDYFVSSLQDERGLRGLLGEDTRGPAYGRLRTVYRRQYQRLGITVTDQEIVDAARETFRTARQIAPCAQPGNAAAGSGDRAIFDSAIGHIARRHLRQTTVQPQIVPHCPTAR